MTAAGDKREEVEAILWRLGLPRESVSEVMAAALAWVKAAVNDSRDPKAPGAPAVPATHYEAGAPPGPACLQPYDRGRVRWATTGTPGDVTCGHCRKRPAWLEASGGAP